MVNKNNDWHRERRVGEAVKAGIKCFCGIEAYRDILEVTMNCETFPRVHRIFCPNCGLQMRSPAGNDDDFIVRQWRDISDLHQHRKAQEARVMTLEEVKRYVYGMPYIIETNKPREEPRLMYGLYSHQGVNGCFYFAFTDARSHFFDVDYGKRWRCWTSRPTDEQREAVKWDAQEQRDYEAAVEMAEYCERYEPTYNADDGSM